MNRIGPTSLFGQIILLLVAGLIVSHGIGWWMYAADKEEAVRAVGGFATAQRIANVAQLLRDTPLDWRARLVAALSDPNFQVSLTPAKPRIERAGPDDVATQAIQQFLSEQLPPAEAGQLTISVRASQTPPFGPGPGFGAGPMAGHGPMMAGIGRFRDLQATLPMADGQWLSVATTVPDTGPAFSRQFLVSMGIMALIILGVAAWAARRVTAPLAALAAAAERLGRDVGAPPMPILGSLETRKASLAFNQMQERIRGFIDNRTNLLAAISHDLRTPLTLLRLRAEGVESGAEREKMLATIAEMDAMIGSTLEFARSTSDAEAPRATDIAALLQSIVDDMAEAGLDVAMSPSEPAIAEVRPAGLKRALTNLLDNAVKYGRRARASVDATSGEVSLRIDDEGPGIPEHELERVFQPFLRLETSRSRETGGVGLGLAIAQSIIIAQGGTLTLSNRAEGGLRATIVLPR